MVIVRERRRLDEIVAMVIPPNFEFEISSKSAFFLIKKIFFVFFFFFVRHLDKALRFMCCYAISCAVMMHVLQMRCCVRMHGGGR